MDVKNMEIRSAHGIEKLSDRLLSQPHGRLVVLDGAPGVGKTTLAIKLAYHMSKENRVGFFSFDISYGSFVDLLLNYITGIPLSRLKQARLRFFDVLRLKQAVHDVCKKDLFFVPSAGKTVSEIYKTACCRRFDVVIVDCPNLSSVEASDRYDQGAKAFAQLAEMAHRCGFRVVFVATNALYSGSMLAAADYFLRVVRCRHKRNNIDLEVYKTFDGSW